MHAKSEPQLTSRKEGIVKLSEAIDMFRQSTISKLGQEGIDVRKQWNYQFNQPNLFFFLAIFRVKTMYLEQREKRGIEISSDSSIVSVSDNYMAFYRNDMNSAPEAFINKIIKDFKEEQSCGQDQTGGLYRGYFGHYGYFTTDERAKMLIRAMLRFDLEAVFQGDNFEPAWPDVRVTKEFFERAIKMRSVWNQGATVSHQGGGKFDTLADLVIYGNFKSPGTIPFNPNVAICHLSYQLSQVIYDTHGTTDPLMLVRVQPRRVTVHDQGLSKPPVMYATYQYLELVSQMREIVIHPLSRYSKERSKQYYKRIQSSLDQVIESDRKKYKLNPNGLHCFLPERVFSEVPLEQLRKHAFFTLNNVVTVEEVNEKTRISPKVFEDIYISPSTALKLQKKNGEWINPGELSEADAKYQSKHKIDKSNEQVQEQILDQVSDEEGTQQLLRFIKSIPKIKFKLTGEQDLMISTPENLLCLGRSGTGKTTSSALRLFASDAFFKFKEQLHDAKAKNPQMRNKDFQISSDFMEQESKLKLLFVSASPVLVNEVKRFYVDLKVHLRDQLINVRAKKQEQEESKGPGPAAIDPTEQELLERFVQVELAGLQSDEHLEQQTSIASRFSQLQPHDYPLFLTMKRLVDMMDASTRFPFFARDAQGKQIGLSGNLEWSNEQGGVFMINHYFKQQKDFDELVQGLGKKILDFSSAVEVQEQLNDEEAAKNEQQELYAEIVAGDRNKRVSDQDKQLSLTSQNLSFEVDFDVFSMRFWPKVAPSTKVQPLVAWTEICSEIKGRVDSFEYIEGGIPSVMYISKSGNKKKKASSGFLTEAEKSSIYWIFLKYEQWKQHFRAYDQNDVVNHILQQMKQGNMSSAPKMHFLMVDEVQDLTQNVISLLMTMAEKNIFFSGDTAQTIAKGVGFRFYDLKTIFDDKSAVSGLHSLFQPPKVLQLTKNFRSHCRILDCANSVVSLLELLFPKTIDKLLKETSDIDGPKPIIIEQTKKPQLESLLNNYLIWGGKYSNGAANQSNEVAFGCDRVVIVRDQESKASVPEFLNNVLCLTVYEAKGLEFDEVILFNFFTDTKCPSQWKLLNEVLVEQTVQQKKEMTDFLDFEMLDAAETAATPYEEPEEADDEAATKRMEDGCEVSTTLHLKTAFAEVYRKFSQVCTELKLLYVAVTRPRKLLVIYDENSSLRTPLQKHWAKVGVVDVITASMIADPTVMVQSVAQTLRVGDEMSSTERTAEAQNAVQMQWRVQGIKLFKAKLYQAAKQCFQNSHDSDLFTRCQAYESAEKAMNLRGQSEAKVAFYKDKSNYLKANERNLYRQQAKTFLDESKALMRQAGAYFRQIGLDKHAAQCFYSGDDNENAVELFVKLGQVGQAAQSYLQLGKLREAANLYSKAGLFANAFECYERLEDWDGLIQCLYRNKAKLDEQERATYIEKYFPIVLNSVYHLYAELDPEGASQIGMSEQNKGRVMQNRLRLKFQKSISVIREEVSENEDEDASESDEEERKAVVKVSQNNVEAAAIEQPAQEESKEPASVMIKTTPDYDEEEKKGDEDDEEYSIISGGECEENLEEETKEQPFEQSNRGFEVLSQIDPDDEFLKSEHSYSLIDKLSSSQHTSFEVLSAHSSEFSILSGTKMHNLLESLRSETKSMSLASEIQGIDGQSNASFADLLNTSKFSAVKYARDSYAEDIVLQKVIYYISLFKDDVRQALHAKRSKDQLAQVLLEIDEDAAAEDQKADIEEDLDFMMIELDDLPMESLGLILDTLEHYELYRLCLVLCGRYKLHERVGRYVSAVSQKYSNLNAKRTNLYASQNNAQSSFSLVAHEAMHNVISLASTCIEESRRGLAFRQSCFETLLLHGFWKKLIYMLDVDGSLQLCMAFGDDESYRLNYLVEKLGISDASTIQQALGSHKKFHELASKTKSSAVWDAYATQLLAREQTKEKITEFAHICKVMGPGQEEKLRIRTVAAVVVMYEETTKEKVRKFARLWETSFKPNIERANTLMRTLFNIQKSLIAAQGDEDMETQRIVYEQFGISWLDGFDLFSNFSPNYCLIKFSSLTESQKFMIAKLRSYQNHLFSLHRNEALFELMNEKSVEFNAYRQFVNERMDKIEASQKLLGQEFTMACDLQMDYFLVPKLWVKEIVLSRIASFTDSFSNMYLWHQLNGTVDILKMKKSTELAIRIMGKKKFILHSCFESERKTINSNPKNSENGNRYSKALHTEIVTAHPKDPSFAKATAEKQAYLDKRVQKAMMPDRLMFQNRVVLTREAQFSIAERLQNDDRKDQLSLAFTKLRHAMRLLNTGDFYGKIYYATLMFTREDFYQPVLETLSNVKKNSHGPVVDKLSKAMLLLDVHIYQKLNDYNSMIASSLNFIHASYQQMPTTALNDLILQVFYQSAFSYKMFNYKESHGGMFLPFDDFVRFIDQDQAKDSTVAFELPRLAFKPATLAQVGQTIAWVAAIAQAMSISQEDLNVAKRFMEDSAIVIIVLTKNFSGEELLRMVKDMNQIVQSLLSTGQKQFAFLKNLQSIGHCKSAAEVKNIIVKIKTERDGHPLCKISTPANGRKHLKTDQYRDDIQAHLNQQLNVASQVENRIKEQRQQAAAKINIYWKHKMQSLVARKQRQISMLVNQEINEGAIVEPMPGYRASKLQSFYDSPSLQKASARCPQLQVTLDRADTLTRSLTFLLASVFVKSALDQEFLLSKLKLVHETRRELIAFIEGAFSESNTVITVGAISETKARIQKLWVRAIAEKALLDDWLQKSDGQLALSEQKKSNFRKMEKWNSVFAANRATRKKRSLLEMMKKTKK